MSTPAAAALSDAGSSAPAAAPANGAAPAAGAPAANANAFWSSWNLPDQKETRDWVANKNYETPFVLAKTAQQLEREAATLRAGKGYPVAGPDGKIDPNADKAWRALTGVPETADKYDIPLPENNPYPQFKTFMAEELHKAGVPAAMAPALARGYEAAVSKMETQLRAEEDAKSTAALKELEHAWGSNYQERMAMAARGKNWLAQEVGGLNDTQLRVMESVMGTDKFLSAMWKIGAGNGEARFAGDNLTGGRSFTGGASEAQARMEQITRERSAGEISDMQWRELSKPGGEIDQLRDRIVAGMAPQ
jgi:hypothetical protein